MSGLASLGVFCGSRRGADPAHARSAELLGRTLAERGIRLVYGGGNVGLMGVMAQAALAGDGEVVGVIPDFLVKREVGDPGVTELIVVDSMHDRKRRMFELSDGFAVLPGGLGTLDEAFEIITWRLLGLHHKPIAFLNIAGCWDPFEALVDGIVDGGFAYDGTTGLFTMTSSVAELLEVLGEVPAGAREAPARRL